MNRGVYLFMLRRSKLIFLLLLIAFTAQQFSIPLAITPIRPYMVLVVIFCLAIFIKLVQGRSIYLHITIIDQLLLLLYGYMSFTVLYAADLALGVHLIVGLMLLVASFFIIKIYASSLSLIEVREILVLTAKVFFLSSFIWYVVGLVAVYIFNISLESVDNEEHAYYKLYGVFLEGGAIPRLRGLCDSPNNFGMYSVFFLPILLAYERKLPFYLYGIMAISILATMSATTYVAFVSLFLVWILSSFFKLKFKKVVSFLMITTMLSFICYLFFELFASNSILESLDHIAGDRLARAETGSGRWELWEFTLGLIQNHPILGYGLNQSRDLLLPLRALKSTHNNVLELLIEGGVIALFLYILLLAACLFCIYGKIKSKLDRTWIFHAFIGAFIFSNANVTVYNDSFILLLALISIFIVKTKLALKDINNEGYVLVKKHD